MSMFHELMMRKKEEIMYATIKGTLTENDGVFSGFAYNNYLATQEEFDCSKDFEITTKLNTGEQSVTQFKVFCRNTFGANASTSIGFAIGVENSKIKAFFRRSDGTVIGSQSGNNGITTFANNVDCFFRFSQKKYNNTYTIQIESSLDNVNWVKEVNLTSSLPIRTSGQGLAFGGGSFSNTSQYWAGSIDLNNSYIKIGATKYKLQAVVGYTIVGSPTIVDGVVSGFSSANYLTLPSVDFSSNFESQVAFTVNTYSTCGIMCLNSYTYKGWHCIGSNLLSFTLNISDGENSKNIRASFTISNNTFYIANAKRVGNNVVCSLYSNGSLVNQQTITIDDGYHVVQGTGYNIGKNTVGAFDGMIDLNNTYIKINNKLWFNGQQA